MVPMVCDGLVGERYVVEWGARAETSSAALRGVDVGETCARPTVHDSSRAPSWPSLRGSWAKGGRGRAHRGRTCAGRATNGLVRHGASVLLPDERLMHSG